MSYKKTVYYLKDGKIESHEKECCPSNLQLTSRYIMPYWFDALRNVFEYEKKREFTEAHHLIDDSRIAKGLELYHNNAIIDATITTVHGGDVRASVKGNTDTYTVIIKNFLPIDDKPPQYNYQREQFWTNLYVDCNCPDHQVAGHYKNNASLICGHCACLLWYLIDKWNMPKIFISDEERMLGLKRSDAEEIETNIYSMPLVKFRFFINILLLKKFRGLHPGLSLSIHRISNENDEEWGKPIWLTMIEPKDVERLITGISKAYTAMEISHDKTLEQIEERLCTLLKIKPKTIEKVVETVKVVERVVEKTVKNKYPWWHFWK